MGVFIALFFISRVLCVSSQLRAVRQCRAGGDGAPGPVTPSTWGKPHLRPDLRFCTLNPPFGFKCSLSWCLTVLKRVPAGGKESVMGQLYFPIYLSGKALLHCHDHASPCVFFVYIRWCVHGFDMFTYICEYIYNTPTKIYLHTQILKANSIATI